MTRSGRSLGVDDISFIKGLTVTINGDTRPLSEALKSSETAARSASRELAAVNKALKLDPGNTVLLTQKQRLLADQAEATRKKLDTLKIAEEEASNALTDGGSSEALRSIQREIAVTESKLRSIEREADKTGEALEKGGKDGAKGQKEAKRAVQDVGEASAQSGDKVQSFGDVLKGSLAAHAIMGGIRTIVNGIKSIGSTAMEQLDYLGELDDNAQKVQMSAEALQEWLYAAKQNGMESETLVKALEKQQKAFASAANGSQSLVEAYAMVGLDVSKFERSEDMLTALIDKLADCTDETTRNYVASTIFGKSYAELAPLFMQGSEGVAALRQEARELGAVISNETVAAGADAGDCFERLNTVWDATKSKVLAGMLPSLVQVSDTLRGGLNSKTAQEQLQRFGRTLGQLTSKAMELAAKALPKVCSMLEYVAQNGKALLAATASGIVAIKGFAIVNSIKRTVTAIKGLNAVIASNPIGLAVTAIAGLVSVLALLSTATGNAARQQEELSKAYRDAAQSAADAAQERAEAGRNMASELKDYDSLIGELKLLCDANGRVKEGHEQRVQYILSQLKDASGKEIEMIDGTISKYDELTGSIHNAIVMRQAEQYLTNTQSAYDTAKSTVNSTDKDSNGNYTVGSAAAVEQTRAALAELTNYKQMYEEVMRLQDAHAKGLVSDAELESKRSAYMRETLRLAEQYGVSGADDLIGKTLSDVEARASNARYAYDQNRTIISQFDAVQNGVWSEDAKETSDALAKAAAAQMDATTASYESLKRQSDDALATFAELRELSQADSSAVTPERVKEAGDAAISACAETYRAIVSNAEQYSQADIQAARETLERTLTDVYGFTQDEVATYIDQIMADLSRSGAQVASAMANAGSVANGTVQSAIAGIQRIVNAQTGALAATAAAQKSTQSGIAAQSATQVQETTGAAGAAVSSAIAGLITSSNAKINAFLTTTFSGAQSAGKQFSSGIVRGIQGTEGQIYASLRRVAAQMVQELRDAIDAQASSSNSGPSHKGLQVQRTAYPGDADWYAQIAQSAQTVQGIFGGELPPDAEQRTVRDRAAENAAIIEAYSAVPELAKKLDRIYDAVAAIDPTMVLDDGTLIARTDRTIGQQADINIRRRLT